MLDSIFPEGGGGGSLSQYYPWWNFSYKNTIYYTFFSIVKLCFVCYFSNHRARVTIHDIFEFNLNDRVEIQIVSLYDTEKYKTEFDGYKLEMVNATENTTLQNPMHKLNLTLLQELSLFSCIEASIFTGFKSWFAYLNRDIPIRTDSPDQYMALSPSTWAVPNDEFASGSGKLSLNFDGVYLITASISFENLDKDELHVSFLRSSEHPVCHAVITCVTPSPCNKALKFSCLAKLSLGDSLDIFTKTKSPSSIKVLAKSERKINFFGQAIAGMSVTPLLTYTLTTTSTKVWQEIGNWSTKNTTFASLFMEKFSTYYNEFIFEETGVYHVNLNLLFEVLECTNQCSERYFFNFRKVIKGSNVQLLGWTLRENTWSIPLLVN